MDLYALALPIQEYTPSGYVNLNRIFEPSRYINEDRFNRIELYTRIYELQKKKCS